MRYFVDLTFSVDAENEEDAVAAAQAGQGRLIDSQAIIWDDCLHGVTDQ